VTKKTARRIATIAVMVVALVFIVLSVWQIVEQVFGPGSTRHP
jgi:hypothetical protein